MSPSLRPENPWIIVFGCTLALVVGNAPLVFYTAGVFLKPMTEEFGWTRGMLTGASAVGSVLSALIIPFIGRLIDRYGVKRVLVPSILLFAASIASMAIVPAIPLLVTIVYCLIGLTGAAHGPLPYVKTVSAWIDGRRGLAIGIVMSGIGIGGAIIPPTVSVIIETFSWRVGFLALSATLLLVALPAVLILVREPTSAMSPREALQARDALPGCSVRDALRQARFWVLGVVVLAVATVVNGTIVHIVPLLTDGGISPAAAASMLGAVGISTMVGRLTSGYLIDRFFAPKVAAVFFLLPCFGLYVLMTDVSGPWVLVGIVSLGLASGCEVDVIGFLTSRYFGLKRFGELYGYLFAAFAVGTAVGPVIAGSAFDYFGSYNGALIGFMATLVAASLTVSTLGQYTYPAVELTPSATSTRPLPAVE